LIRANKRKRKNERKKVRSRKSEKWQHTAVRKGGRKIEQAEDKRKEDK
jgi:hypothetical protein